MKHDKDDMIMFYNDLQNLCTNIVSSSFLLEGAIIFVWDIVSVVS